MLEQTFKVIAKGKQYFVDWQCLYEGIISLALFAIELAQLVMYGFTVLVNIFTNLYKKICNII